MTAFVNKDTVDKCRKSGMEGILYKPVSREGLMKQVDKFYNSNGEEPKKVHESSVGSKPSRDLSDCLHSVKKKPSKQFY